MTKAKQLELINNLDKSLIEILISKGEDYASDDVLSNFKRLSAASSALSLNTQTAVGYALFMVLMKIDRISNLLNSAKIPNNEGIEDSFADGINYMKLAYLCY